MTMMMMMNCALILLAVTSIILTSVEVLPLFPFTASYAFFLLFPVSNSNSRCAHTSFFEVIHKIAVNDAERCHQEARKNILKLDKIVH